MSIPNDYSEAIPLERGLFVVQLRDGGWSIADGPGTQLLLPDELQRAGYHLPVRFPDRQSATSALRSGPSAWFDVHPDSIWVRHCLEVGGTYWPEYERPRGPSDLSQRSG
jgi:hypothetical protein